MKTLLVTDKLDSWLFANNFTTVIHAEDYLTQEVYIKDRSLRVVNLCQSYRYQSLGYYVSLLAEARGHKITPSALSIQDLKNTTLSATLFDSITSDVQKLLSKIKANEFELSIYFGKNIAKHYEKLCKKLYSIFPAPLMRITFVHKKIWLMKKVSLITINDVPDAHKKFLHEAAEDFFRKRSVRAPNKKNTIFDLAILLNDEEKTPPSNKTAIKKFITAAEKLDINIDLINSDDYRYISEYDGLFIRETTAVNHYTYRFARRAAADGMVVIDSPESILKCSNKVYLAELLNKYKIKTPKTIILHKNNWQEMIQKIGFPCILKLPESCFSIGVKKIQKLEEYVEYMKTAFSVSDLIIAQSYMPTDFDWRIGVFDDKPLFACQYYMAKGHWQIYNWNNDKVTAGGFQVVPINEVPSNVINAALRATKPIGNGLYGVDIKHIKNEAYVIEVNDNPNIDAGIEDKVEGEQIYNTIMQGFLTRLKQKKGYV